MIRLDHHESVLTRWNNRQKKYSFNSKKVEQSIVAAVDHLGLKNKEINIVLVGIKKIIELNRQYRGIAGSTDVLAFPVDVDYFDKRFLGDIFICCEVASRQAKLFKHSLEREISILVLHGILHLLGYDHLSDLGEMSSIESNLRNCL